jgi:hypothetical protein
MGGTMIAKSVKAKVYLMLVIVVLVLAALACGSSDEGAVVNPPSEDGDGDVAEQPAVEATETKPVGSARSNPAPVGSEVVADDMAFKVLSIIRPADDIVLDEDNFNIDPEPGQEYLLVELEITCQESSDEQCNLSSFWNLSVLGSAGVSHDMELMVTGVEGLLPSVEFYGGSTVSGYVPFIVGQDETDLLLVYEPMFLGDTFYLALPNQ